MKLEIVKYPDPRLAQKSEPITEITAEIKQLAADMLETMYAAPGVGLAAPQIGRNIRLIVVDPIMTENEDERQPLVLINPVLTLGDEEIESKDEGCLSVPLDYRATVKRASKVHLQALNLDGEEINTEVEGFLAIILQHECDHLEGILFIDHISRLRRNLYNSKVQKWLKKQNTA